MNEDHKRQLRQQLAEMYGISSTARIQGTGRGDLMPTRAYRKHRPGYGPGGA